MIKWLWRLLGAAIGLVVGSVLAVATGDVIAKALGISNFEGGRGYFVAFVLLPLFAVAGALLGAVMVHRTWRFNLSVLAILFVLGGAFVLTNREQFFEPPPQVESLGNFDLLTYQSENWGERFALRYRGASFPIVGRAGMFGDETATYNTINAVFTITPTLPAPAPFFIVNVGDPNNSSYFYLVQEVNGAPAVTYLSDTSSKIAADWLDQAPADPTVPRTMTVHRGRLSGGRWLLLGDNCVFDVQTLTAYPFVTAPLQDGVDAWLYDFKLPIGFAPDEQSFVRVGGSQRDDAKTNEYLGTVVRLLVFDFVHDTSYSLLVDRARMRYNRVEELDGAWLDHYFMWQAAPGAADRLVERPDFTPLPYHGSLTVDYDGYREYTLQPVKAAMVAVLIDFLQHDYGAVVAANTQYDATNQSVELTIGEQTIHLLYSADGYSPPALSLWMDRGVESQRVAEIAQRFDAVLQTGAHDTLFLGDQMTE